MATKLETLPSAQPQVVPSIPSEGLIRVSQLLAFGSRKGSTPILPISRATMYTWIREGKMPAPIRIGAMVCWPAPQLRSWLEALSAGSQGDLVTPQGEL
jgi:predicted DNA-binding transcriptional regulator AlpA